VKIYTKTGDKGDTGLYSGRRVSKSHVRLHAYGSLDELNSHLGLLRDQVSRLEQFPEKEKNLISIQAWLFSIGSHLANDSSKMKKNLPIIEEEWIKMMENEIDEMTLELSPLKNFILPGGHSLVSQIHIARTVCRRGERWTIDLQDSISKNEVSIPTLAIPFLNRLSDYLFTLSRWFSMKLGSKEIHWKPMS
tara:strand:+ start:5299 stop:5874 length:576 start_codon:yes stop_codon:yes gene_type:complete